MLRKGRPAGDSEVPNSDISKDFLGAKPFLMVEPSVGGGLNCRRSSSFTTPSSMPHEAL